jgi:glycosyltransferase involved in cell wall biosynthesis
MQSQPTISIVTTSMNCGHLLRRCIESVISQEYPNIEHIVVDGISSDNTLDVIRSFPHIRWLSERNYGESQALNKAIRLARGEIVCFLNADALLSPGALALVANTFRSNPSCKLLYGNTSIIDVEGKVISEHRPPSQTSLKSLLRWWQENSTPHRASVFISRSFLNEVGPVNEDLPSSSEWDLWLRCAARCSFSYVNQVLSCATQTFENRSPTHHAEWTHGRWQVFSEHLSLVSSSDRTDLWEEYYEARLTESANERCDNPTRYPESDEALLALVRIIAKQAKPLAVLAQYFPEENVLAGVTQQLLEKGLQFQNANLIAVPDSYIRSRRPQGEKTIVLDGVFFERARSGVYRMWACLLKEWSLTPFAQRLVVLDRSGCAPRFPGIRYRILPRTDTSNLEHETAMLSAICEQENAGLFVSTYYTSVESIPSVMPMYDMIPEKTGMDLSEPDWVAKHLAIKLASGFCCISESARADLLELFPAINPKAAVVTYCGLDHAMFKRASPEEIERVRLRYGLTKPYFMLVGGRKGYKNAEMFLEAMKLLPTQDEYQVLVTGSTTNESLSPETVRCEIIAGMLRDEDLCAAYSGAVALVYPSKYEGFGLPIVEAMACECPVISSPWSSMPEVGGAAVLYAHDPASLSQALLEVQKPTVRAMLISAGKEQALKFRWDIAASQTQEVFERVLSGSAAARTSQARG